VLHDLRLSCGDAFAAGHAMLIPTVPAGRVALFIPAYFAFSALLDLVSAKRIAAGDLS
jgi:hypothetical protein